MWVTRDNNGTLYLWKIFPVRAMERFNNCSKEFQESELFLHAELKYQESFEELRQYWDFPNDATRTEYLGAEEQAFYDSKYRLKIDPGLFPELTWEDPPLEVCLCISNKEYHTVRLEELNRLYEVDWRYQDMKETVESYQAMIEDYRKLPWYKRILRRL